MDKTVSWIEKSRNKVDKNKKYIQRFPNQRYNNNGKVIERSKENSINNTKFKNKTDKVIYKKVKFLFKNKK